MGGFVFRLLGLVRNSLVGWGSGSGPASKGAGLVGAPVALRRGHSSSGDRSCPCAHSQLGTELQRGENGVGGFAEGLQQPPR